MGLGEFKVEKEANVTFPTSKIDKEKLKERYDELRPFYKRMGDGIKKSFEKILDEHNISVHGVYCRIKDFNSFLEKIERKKYDKPFQEITDLLGLRIICYYPSDLKKIQDLIRFEFNVNEIVNNNDSKDPERFGYVSTHFIIQIKDQWLSHPLYRDLRGFKAEIQIRTILMHAWADISHQLVYKNEESVPNHLKRNLNRISALFEITDEQFDLLKKEKEDYVNSLLSDDGVFDVDKELNIDSLSTFLDNMFRDRDRSEVANAKLLDDINYYNKHHQKNEDHITFRILLDYVDDYKGVIELQEKIDQKNSESYEWRLGRFNQAGALERIIWEANKNYINYFAA